MPRLFTAIDIGADAKSQIADSQVQLATAIRASSLRWTKREQWHITLVFIGEVPDDRAARIVELMREALPHPSFRFELGGLGTFPSRGAPRALWIGVRSGADQIIRVQSLVADRLELAGVERERRPFSPHLTLARWRGSRPSDRPHTTLGGTSVTATTEVRAVTLFQSRMSPAGSTYTLLAECPLLASAPVN